MNPEPAIRQVLYFETETKDRYKDDDDPDMVCVSVIRWSTKDDSVVILSRESYAEGQHLILDQSIMADRFGAAKLQRIGIRVFDELKAAHPTLCNE